MSWSASAKGLPAEVRAKIAEQIKGCVCPEPEETIKAKAADIIDYSLSKFPGSQVVSVSAYGSQGASDGEVAYQSLSITITPDFGTAA